MNRIQVVFFLLMTVLTSTGLYAQMDSYHASVETQGVLTTKNTVPFWMRANQFGSVPLPGVSGSVIGMLRKDYDTLGNMPTDDVSGDHTKVIDWGAGLEIRGDMGYGLRSRLNLIEGYAKLKVSIFELKAGRTKDIMGLVDTTLSSGAFSVSGNALGIPKISLAIPNYWNLPLTGGLLAIKGNFAHGWIGQQPIVTGYLYFVNEQTYYHQSSFYGRLGKENWSLKLYGGVNHQAYWGMRAHDKGYQLSEFKSFEYVVLGKTYHGSKVGNHIGSVDLGLTYDFPGVTLSLYRQSFYDEGALSKLANIKDGMNGISLTNTAYDPEAGGFQWHKLLFEFFYTKDQAGYPTSRVTKSGDENYYNNNEYYEGWSYKGVGLGNPFITPYMSTRKNLVNDIPDYFNNNRVVAFYGGADFSVEDFHFVGKASYTLNYGTFGTSIWGHSRGTTFYPPRYGIWQEVRQFSGYLEVNKPFGDTGWQIGCVAALDNGGLFYNSGGFLLKLKRSFGNPESHNVRWDQ